MKTIITLEDAGPKEDMAIDTTLEFIADTPEELHENSIMPLSAMLGGFIVHLIESGEITKLADEYYLQKERERNSNAS